MNAALQLDPNDVRLETDPIWCAFLDAPQGPPLSGEERVAVEESERLIAAGEPGASIEEMEQVVERMRAEQGDVAEK